MGEAQSVVYNMVRFHAVLVNYYRQAQLTFTMQGTEESSLRSR